MSGAKDGLTIEDKEAIREVITAYAHAVDRHRWDIMDQVFHEDATFGFGPIKGSWQDFVVSAKSILTACTATHHQLGQILIAGDGPDAAHAETYMTAMHIVPAGYPETDVFPDRGEEYSATIAGRYVDRFEKRGGEWRIADRRGIYDWREYRDIGPANLSIDVPDEARGQYDDSDPSTPAAKYWRGN